MKYYALLSGIVFLCLTSCKKENKFENLYFSDTLLSQVNSGDQAVHGLIYNSNYLIYESTEPFIYKKFTYDNRNLLIKQEAAVTFGSFSCVAVPGMSLESDPRKAGISQYSEFEYDDALKLIKKSNYYINGGKPVLTSYETFDRVNDKIVKLSIYNPQGELTSYDNYTYDDHGNMTRDDTYIVSTVTRLDMSKIFEFDNKNNPYQVLACEGEPGINTNRNNVVKETSVFYSGTTEHRYETLHTYEYNSLDYPVRIDKFDCIYGK